MRVGMNPAINRPRGINKWLNVCCEVSKFAASLLCQNSDYVYTPSIFFGDVLLERDKCHTISQSSQADKLVTPPRISIFIVFDCTTDIKSVKHGFFCSCVTPEEVCSQQSTLNLMCKSKY